MLNLSLAQLVAALAGVAAAVTLVGVGAAGLAVHRARLRDTWLFTVCCLAIAWSAALTPMQDILGGAHPWLYVLPPLVSGYAAPALMLFSLRAIQPRRAPGLGWLLLGLPGTGFCVAGLAAPALLDFVVAFRTVPDAARWHWGIPPFYLLHGAQMAGCALVGAVALVRALRAAPPGPFRRGLAWLLAAEVQALVSIAVYTLLPGALHWTGVLALAPWVSFLPMLAFAWRAVTSLTGEAERSARAEAARGRLASVARALAGLGEGVGRHLAEIAEQAAALGAAQMFPAERREHARRLAARVTEAERLTERMLRFARPPGVGAPESELLPVIQGAMRRFAADGGRASLEVGPGAEGARATVDPGALDAALDAGLANARDAGDPHPVVRVRIERGVALDARALGAELDGEDAVCVEIADRGHGMADATAERAPEPFYTTRPGRSGLGLVDAVSCARSAGGALRIESVPGAGTTLRLYLPLAAAAPAARDASPAPPPAPADVPVLLAIDDPVAAEAIALMLDARGLPALPVATLAAARRCVAAWTDRPLVVLVRPDADAPAGDRAALALLAAHPTLDLTAVGASPAVARALRRAAPGRVHALRAGAALSAVAAHLAERHAALAPRAASVNAPEVAAGTG